MDARQSSQPLKIDKRALDMLVENMSGLSESDTRQLARNAIYQHGALQISTSRR
jgi:hypothetical protein